MENKIIELLRLEKYAELIKLCIENKLEGEFLSKAISKINNQVLDNIRTSYIGFMEQEDNVYSDDEKHDEINKILAELYKTKIGALLVLNS